MTTTPDDWRVDLRILLHRAQALDAELPGPRGPDGSGPLTASVVRPMAAMSADGDAPGPAGSAFQPEAGDPQQRLWELTKDATRLRVSNGLPGLVEATAALQYLSCLFAADETELEARVAELAALQAALPARIDVAPDGPYLVTNSATLTNWLGEPMRTFPQMALCRCGASETKPLCDGSHAHVGFSGAKDPNRVPDQLDTYEGVQVTVTDNRGICAHSGFCTDRLPTAFRQDKEPFVAPNGGRADEVLAAVRTCPSGALGSPQAPPIERDPAIEVSKDGPYRVTGSIPLDGDATREHYSLCRCGHSRNKPFCSGMHYYVGFQDPPISDKPTLYEWAGGLPALTRMTKIFYGKYVPADEFLAPLFARMAPDHPERVAAWLAETFGGPKLYTERYGGYDRMIGEHAGKSLTEQWRARWTQLISRSADDAGLPTDPEFRAAFVSYIEWGSRIAVENSQPEATPPPHMPVPKWWWVCEATPGSRVSALDTDALDTDALDTDATGQSAGHTDRHDHRDHPEDLTMPGPNESVSFEAHIKPLFREFDRRSMRFVFDLWSHTDVSQHANAILARLRQGSMPCDGGWPAERVDLFARWVGEGTPA